VNNNNISVTGSGNDIKVGQRGDPSTKTDVDVAGGVEGALAAANPITAIKVIKWLKKGARVVSKASPVVEELGFKMPKDFVNALAHLGNAGQESGDPEAIAYAGELQRAAEVSVVQAMPNDPTAADAAIRLTPDTVEATPSTHMETAAEMVSTGLMRVRDMQVPVVTEVDVRPAPSHDNYTTEAGVLSASQMITVANAAAMVDESILRKEQAEALIDAISPSVPAAGSSEPCTQEEGDVMSNIAAKAGLCRQFQRDAPDALRREKGMATISTYAAGLLRSAKHKSGMTVAEFGERRKALRHRLAAKRVLTLLFPPSMVFTTLPPAFRDDAALMTINVPRSHKRADGTYDGLECSTWYGKVKASTKAAKTVVATGVGGQLALDVTHRTPFSIGFSVVNGVSSEVKHLRRLARCRMTLIIHSANVTLTRGIYVVVQTREDTLEGERNVYRYALVSSQMSKSEAALNEYHYEGSVIFPVDLTGLKKIPDTDYMHDGGTISNPVALVGLSLMDFPAGAVLNIHHAFEVEITSTPEVTFLREPFYLVDGMPVNKSLYEILGTVQSRVPQEGEICAVTNWQRVLGEITVAFPFVYEKMVGDARTAQVFLGALQTMATSKRHNFTWISNGVTDTGDAMIKKLMATSVEWIYADYTYADFMYAAKVLLKMAYCVLLKNPAGVLSNRQFELPSKLTAAMDDDFRPFFEAAGDIAAAK